VAVVAPRVVVGHTAAKDLGVVQALRVGGGVVGRLVKLLLLQLLLQLELLELLLNKLLLLLGE
jgi:hypothetical protein